MPYRIPTFQVASDAPLACRLTMKRAHVAHYESILARAHGRWFDQGRRHLAQLRADLAALEARLPSAPPGAGSSPPPGVS